MPCNKKIWLLSRSISIIILLSSLATAFESSFNSPFVQCGAIDLEWWGDATPPFSLFVVPIDSNIPFLVKIPENPDTWDAASSKGSYKLPSFQLPAGTSFLTSFADIKDFGNGGVSVVHTIEESGNTSCLPPPPTSTAEPTPKLIIAAPPRQCEEFTMSWNMSSPRFSDRVYIRGWVPGGRAFSLDPPAPMSNITGWTVDTFAGTQFVLMLSTGGVRGRDTLLSTTPLFTVLGDELSKNKCIRPGKSPSSTTALPRPTSSMPPAIGPQESKKSMSAAVIAGSVVGGVVALLLLAFLLFWLYRRRKAKHNQLSALDAWPEPLIVDTAASSPSGNIERGQKGQEAGEVSRTVARDEPSVVAPTVSFGGILSTGQPRHHGPDLSLSSPAGHLDSSTQDVADQSPQSPQEDYVMRHRDGGPIELPPLYEEAHGPGRVGSAAAPARPTQGNDVENK